LFHTLGDVMEADEIGSVIVAFRAPKALADAAERAAAREGISRSDVARRALIRDLAPREREAAAS
jgi:hypothetical protein